MTRRGETAYPALVGGILLVAAIALFLANLSAAAPNAIEILLAMREPSSPREALVLFGLAPRFAVGLLCGAALGLAGALFQQTLRNPLAEPGTLGVFAGAQLALTACALWLPAAMRFGAGAPAFAGATAAAALVLAMVARRGFAPLALILAGMIVSIHLGAANATLSLFNHQVLEDLFVWQAGSLVQNDWSGALWIGLFLIVAAIGAIVLTRALRMLELSDESARAAGAGLAATRLGAIALAVGLTATVAAVGGPIGFIGLLGPLAARLAGARRTGAWLFWSAMCGACLLGVADQAVARLQSVADLPTGAVVATIGAPVLLLLMRQARPAAAPAHSVHPLEKRTPRPVTIVVAASVLCAAIAVVALALGRTPDGWLWSLTDYLPWRGARVAVAAASGALLAYAGTLLQRMTGNAMASPEILGISSGAALGLIAVAISAVEIDRTTVIAGASLGAFFAIAAIFAAGRRSSFAPDHMLLAGVALAAILGAVSSVIIASGDPRAGLLMNWLAGSTYRATSDDAIAACAAATLALASVPFLARALDILPLGGNIAQSVGLPLQANRAAVMIAASLSTAVATLVVGPLSFVGFLAPHAARMIGLQRPISALLGAMTIGAAVMIAADWAGRIVTFPWQIPAGLIGASIGGAYVTFLLSSRAPKF